MASGFGLPTGLLDIPSTSSPSVLSTSTSVLPIPPAPRFADFRFQNIGQQPRLLTRFTDSNQAQDGTEDESMSTSSDSDQRLQNVEQIAMPRSRPSLWQALAKQDTTFTTTDNPTGQASTDSLRFPIVEAFATDEQQLAKERSTSRPDMSACSTSSRSLSPSHTTSQLPVSASLANFGGNAAHQHSSDSLASMDLGYPSAGSGPNDPPMEDMRPSRAPVPPPLSPSLRKCEGLRQIISRFQANAPPHDYSKPSLTSATLLTKEAQQKAETTYASARVLNNSIQELLQSAQKAHIVASALLKDAEEAKGLADGAKAEIERISFAYADRQDQSNHNAINELFQSLENWITEQEADEAVLQARKVQQLELQKQTTDPVGTSAQLSAQLSAQSLSHSSLDATGPVITPPVSASAPQRQPLFYSPTPEVDVKFNPQISSQPLHPSPALASMTPDPRQERAELRKLFKEKHRSTGEESPGPLSLYAAREQQRQLAGERLRPLEGEKRKQFEEAIIKREGDKSRGKLWRSEEEQRQEEQRQKELTRQEEERKECEETDRRSREEVEKEVREESERSREEKHAREEAEKKRARESLETMRRARAEADRKKALAEAERRTREAEVQRKAQEEELAKKAQEAKKKAQEELQKRKAQEEAQKKRLLLIQQQQEEELQAELRRAQEMTEEQRKLEEQARLKAEQERQEKHLQDQNMRRAQIQAEKDKAMVDHVQQILAQRQHRLQSSLDETSEMSLDSSPAIPALTTSNAPPSLSLASQSSLTQRPPFIQLPPQRVHVDDSTSQASPALNGQTPALGFSQGNSSDPRSFSLPPVTCLSQPERSPSAASGSLPSQRIPTLSVYSLSGDRGNVPYRENNLHSSPPQAQAANIRHVVSALNLQPPVLVKAEPTHDDSKLLYPPSRDRTPVQPQIAQGSIIQNPTLQHSQTHPPDLQPQQSLSASASQPTPLPSAEPTNGSHAYIIFDRCAPSSPAITEIPLNRSQQPQQPQQIPTVAVPTPSQPRAQVPSQPVSVIGSQPQPDHRPVSRAEAQQELIVPSTSRISGRSRSSSPFRMGPDVYLAPQPTTDSSPPETNLNSRAIPTGPTSFRGRLPPSAFIPSAHWDHYSPSPQRPHSPPPRQTDTYRPNYSERAPVLAGKKRSRESSPGAYYRDRDYDDRRAPPLRRSRTPPPRRIQLRRTPSRSRSPSPGSASYRPSLATRLEQGPPSPSDHSYRPVTPRDWERDREPNLLSRFSDTRMAGPPHYAWLRRKRGIGGIGGPPKRGIGGIEGPPPLEERISSGSTLAKRIQEDPRRS